jgi:hypothetical protein
MLMDSLFYVFQMHRGHVTREGTEKRSADGGLGHISDPLQSTTSTLMPVTTTMSGSNASAAAGNTDDDN